MDTHLDNNTALDTDPDITALNTNPNTAALDTNPDTIALNTNPDSSSLYIEKHPNQDMARSDKTVLEVCDVIKPLGQQLLFCVLITLTVAGLLASWLYENTIHRGALVLRSAIISTGNVARRIGRSAYSRACGVDVCSRTVQAGQCVGRELLAFCVCVLFPKIVGVVRRISKGVGVYTVKAVKIWYQKCIHGLRWIKARASFYGPGLLVFNPRRCVSCLMGIPFLSDVHYHMSRAARFVLYPVTKGYVVVHRLYNFAIGIIRSRCPGGFIAAVRGSQAVQSCTGQLLTAFVNCLRERVTTCRQMQPITRKAVPFFWTVVDKCGLNVLCSYCTNSWTAILANSGMYSSSIS